VAVGRWRTVDDGRRSQKQCCRPDTHDSEATDHGTANSSWHASIVWISKPNRKDKRTTEGFVEPLSSLHRQDILPFYSSATLVPVWASMFLIAE
jgi:hypothetical protein